MRKLVLLLLCIALFSYCPKENNYPLIDLITTNTVLEDVKRLFQPGKHDDMEHSDVSAPSNENAIAKLFNKATEAFTDKISDPFREALKGEVDPVEEKGQQSLDLSLPELVEEPFEIDSSSLVSEPESTLPDLFATPESKEKDSRASIGGRLLMDDQNPNYSMDAVLGAEVSLELKTH